MPSQPPSHLQITCNFVMFRDDDLCYSRASAHADSSTSKGRWVGVYPSYCWTKDGISQTFWPDVISSCTDCLSNVPLLCFFLESKFLPPALTKLTYFGVCWGTKKTVLGFSCFLQNLHDCHKQHQTNQMNYQADQIKALLWLLLH